MQPTPSPFREAPSQTLAQSLRSLVRFSQVVRRHKWLMISFVAAVLLLGGLFYSTRTPVYNAEAALLVESTGLDVGPFARRAVPTLMGTYEHLFVSDTVLQDALARLETLPPEINDQLPRERRPKRLRGLLRTAARTGTNVIDVECRSRDPRACVDVIHAIVEASMEFVDTNQKNLAVEMVNNLDAERRDLEKRLSEKEQAILELKKRSGDIGFTVDSDGRVSHPVVQRVVSLNQAYVEAQKRRIELQAAAAAMRRPIPSPDALVQRQKNLELLLGKELVQHALGGAVTKDESWQQFETQLIDEQARLAALQRHYGWEHPKVVQVREKIDRLNALLSHARDVSGAALPQDPASRAGRLLSVLLRELERAAQYEAVVRQEYEQAEAASWKLNDRRAELEIAQREVNLLRHLHQVLLERIANIDVNQNQAQVRLAVLRDPLLPAAPVYPKLPRTVLFSLLLGAALGLASIYVVDLMDDRFRSIAELKEQIGAPVLAVVRSFAIDTKKGYDALQVHTAPQSVESESFRSLRGSLVFSPADTQRLIVTSSEPGDGKTTVIVNLACAFAQAGKRTLLIDADMRKPGLSRLLATHSLKGLSNVLRNEEEVSLSCAENLCTSEVPGLDILFCGPKPLYPVELLSGPRMEQLLEWAGDRYDQILIDSPPLLAVSDAGILSRLVDGVVLVVQPQKNHRRLVLRAAEELRSAQAELLGLVVNRANLHGDDGPEGYGYGYGYGYGTDDEPDDSQASGEDAGPMDSTETSARRAACAGSRAALTDGHKLLVLPRSMLRLRDARFAKRSFARSVPKRSLGTR